MILDIGTLTGTIEIDDKMSSTLTTVVSKLDAAGEAFEGLVGSVAVGAAAAVAAFAAVSAAVIAMGKHGADINDLAATLDHFAGSADDANDILKALQKGTLNTVSNMDLMRSSTRLLSAGVKLTATDFGTLGQAAFVLQNRGLGGTKEMLDLVSDAMITGRTRTLAMKLGVVDADTATAEYARKLGVTEAQLTKTQRAEATRVTILEMLSKANKDAGEQTRDFGEMFEAASTAVGNFFEELDQAVAASPNVMRALGAIQDAFTEAFAGEGKNAIDTIIGAINTFANVVATVGPVAIKWAKGIYDAGADFFKGVGEVKDLFVAFKDFGEAGANAIGRLLEKLAEVIPGMKTLLELYGKIKAEGQNQDDPLNRPLGFGLEFYKNMFGAGAQAMKNGPNLNPFAMLHGLSDGASAYGNHPGDIIRTQGNGHDINLIDPNAAARKAAADAAAAAEAARQKVIQDAVDALKNSQANLLTQAQAWSRFAGSDIGKLPTKVQEDYYKVLQAVIDQYGNLSKLGPGTWDAIYDSLDKVVGKQADYAKASAPWLQTVADHGRAQEESDALMGSFFGAHNTIASHTGVMSDLMNGPLARFKAPLGNGPGLFGGMGRSMGTSFGKGGFLGSLAPTVAAAIAGGGSVTGAVGSLAGQSLGTGLQKQFGGAITKAFGTKGITGALGGALGAALPGIGALIGPLVTKALGALGKAVGLNHEGTDAIREWEKQFDPTGMGHGGDVVRGKLGGLGALGAGLTDTLYHKVGKSDAEGAKRATAAAQQIITLTEGLKDHVTELGVLGPKMWDAIINEADVNKAQVQIKNFTDTLKEAAEAMGRYSLSLSDFQTPAEAAHDSLDRMNKDLSLFLEMGAGKNLESLTKKLADPLNEALRQALDTGQKLGPAFQPFLEQLVKSGGIADDVARKLLGLPAPDVVPWQDMEAAAKEFGIDIENLGPKFRQSKFTDSANDLAGKFKLLTENGVDVTTALGNIEGSSDEAGNHIASMSETALDFVHNAMKFGLEIPPSMKPMLEAMALAGTLTDDTGKKMDSLDGLNFGVDITQKIDDLITKIGELIDKLLLVPDHVSITPVINKPTGPGAGLIDFGGSANGTTGGSNGSGDNGRDNGPDPGNPDQWPTGGMAGGGIIPAKAGGWLVPAGEGGVDEEIRPVGGRRGGGGIVINITAMDGDSVRRTVRSRTFQREFLAAIRDNSEGFGTSLGDELQ